MNMRDGAAADMMDTALCPKPWLESARIGLLVRVERDMGSYSLVSTRNKRMEINIIRLVLDPLAMIGRMTQLRPFQRSK